MFLKTFNFILLNILILYIYSIYLQIKIIKVIYKFINFLEKRQITRVLIKLNIIVKGNYMKYFFKIYNSYDTIFLLVDFRRFLLLDLLYISYFSMERRKFTVFHKNWLATKSYLDIAFLPLT